MDLSAKTFFEIMNLTAVNMAHNALNSKTNTIPHFY